MSDVKVKGLAELQAALDGLPAKIEANIMRGALRAGANVIRAEAKGTVARHSGALADMIAQPRAATVMGLMEEARLGRLRGFEVAQQNGSMKTAFGRMRDFIVGNF